MSSTDDTTAPRPLMRTEARHADTTHLDAMGSLEILRVMNAEDATVAGAVGEALPRLADLVDHALAALEAGGTIHYFGAGTSGRLAVLDAAELIPTFNLEDGRIVAHIAGGSPALVTAVEGSEDSVEDGARAAGGLGAHDVAIGVAASGITPYVSGALAAARAGGARTALITSNPETPLAPLADVLIVADTGPEILTGSTRLKAGTAAKLILNGFSTALMIRYGRVWSNLMVSVVSSNRKLRERSARILVDAIDVTPARAQQILEEAGGDLKAALVSQLAGVAVDSARSSLAENRGSVRASIASLTH